MIEALFILAIASLVLSSVITFDNFIKGQKVEFSELAALDSIALTIGRLVNDNTAWNNTTAGNSMMGCLRNAAGNSCPSAFTRVRFNAVYDTAGAVYYNGSGANGLTQNGMTCTSYPSVRCPFQFVLEFATLNNATVPWVGIFVTLNVGKNPSTKKPYTDLIFNPLQHGYTVTSWPPASLSNLTIIQRLAIYP